ncbi:MAG: hypothetical protein M1834_006517 [Cirrosporium novae-zelandiae]|nr:MAG: hypothetical protein M1834_006517 [Cirrosporium novae-zelandiae]
MAEPTPSKSPPSHDAEDETPDIPKSAEDRRAAAALSSLDAHNEEDEASHKKSHADHEALGKAMSRLEISGGKKPTASKKPAATMAEEKKKAVKVDQADVSLLVDELELPKAKVTDLLKAHEGDAVKALTAFVTVAS